MLIAAAAESWRVPAGEIKAENGIVSHASGKSARYGALAARAASGPVPSNVGLKEPKDWKYIGNETLPRYDSRPKSEGRQQYTIDLREPGMLTAVMIHPPLFGATLRSFDASKAKAMKGVVDVVATPRGVAVVATGMWEAMKAREVVTVEWDDDKAEKRSSSEIADEYRAAADKHGEVVASNDGDVDAAFANAPKLIEARYEFPYLAHASLEPINAAARMNPDGTLEIWGGHQMPDLYQAVAAKVAGITPDKVILRVMKTGGGFGRRASVDSDVIVEAVATAKAIGWKAPVKVQWTREDDMRAGRYRPAFMHKMRAALDGSANLLDPSRHSRWSIHFEGYRHGAGASQKRRGYAVSRRDGQTAICHPERPRRADYYELSSDGTLVAFSGIHAHRVCSRSIYGRDRPCSR